MNSTAAAISHQNDEVELVSIFKYPQKILRSLKWPPRAKFAPHHSQKLSKIEANAYFDWYDSTELEY